MNRNLLTLCLSPLLAFSLSLPTMAQETPTKETPAPAATSPAEKKDPFARPEGVEERPKGTVPEDLLDDEHVQEEFGVSELTTPSIKKIFEDLESLGTLPYDGLKRTIPKGMSSDRTLIALNLGLLIGDGFLSVQSEKISDLEDIGRAILKHAKVLGAGSRVAERTKSIMENSALGDFKELKSDLASAQKEVKQEMVLLRDLDLVHLISLGGWLRGLQIASTASLTPFSGDKARVLGRHDIAEYFAYTLENLNPSVMKLDHMVALRQGLAEIDTIVNLPEGKPLSKEDVKNLEAKATGLLDMITKGEHRDKSDKSDKSDKTQK
jgi:hypothetical protein